MLDKVLSVSNDYAIVDQDLFCEHSRITDLYDEVVVQTCIDSAHDLVQKWLNRPLYPTTFIGVVDEFSPIIYLPNPTVKQVISITAEDADYNEIYLTENVDWKFDCIDETVRFKNNSPTDFTKLNRFKIKYCSGYDPDSDDPVPPAVISAILMTAATLYENREDTIVGTQINEVPLKAQRILRVHRRRTAV